MDNWFEREEIETDILDVVAKLKMPLSVVQGGKRVLVQMERDFRSDLEINMIDLEDQMMDTPSIYAFWSNILSEQQMVVDTLERQLKIRRGAVKRELREEAARSMRDGTALSSRTGLNRDDIDDLMSLDPEIKELGASLIKAKRALSKLWGIVNAVKMKSETMRSLAGFKKQELEDARFAR